jgi:hypothetical protein
MTCPLGTHGGDGLQKWRVVATVLNKQARTVDSGGPSSIGGLGEGLTPPHRKSQTCYELFEKAPELDTSFGGTSAMENGIRDWGEEGCRLDLFGSG